MALPRLRAWFFLVLALCLLVLGYWLAATPRQNGFISNAASISDFLSAGTLSAAKHQFSRAIEPIAFEFPHDHGPHPAFQAEWWYVTGHLNTPEGHKFGFQFTLFRYALSPEPADSNSAWRARDVILGHFAISDFENASFHHFERSSRAALLLAGAKTNPVRIWLDDWSLELTSAAQHQWSLQATRGDTTLQLRLDSTAKIIRHGRDGLSRKSSAVGNASYYYSQPKLRAQGRLKLGSIDTTVSGSAWLDHEWSTSALSPAQAGWDWFALHLNDGSAIMFYRLRNKDGSLNRHSAGTLIEPDGKHIRLDYADVIMQPTSLWLSAKTGIRYPTSLRITIAKVGIDLQLEPELNEQEWAGLIHYWEGAVRVQGTRQGEALSGDGYLELTGYDGYTGDQ